MINNYLSEVRLFEILYEDVNFYDEDVHHILLNYINKYIKFKNISKQEFNFHYENFLKQYSKDIKAYLTSNIYPAVQNGITYNITRVEYDVTLLLSTILTQHRYDIMSEIYKQLNPNSNALVIGSGIGIELELIKESYKKIAAYDVEIDEFCNYSHVNVNFNENEFRGHSNIEYNDIYIIELLEHIPKPYDLIAKAQRRLTINGRILITLAVNIPQFDHIINFDNFDNFLKNIKKMNLYIEYKKEIKHKSIVSDLQSSSNIFIVLKKI
jgi:2-polyprenyl-3-methyl-5-hydroxy-6-metoxy-1,4-benzoquinol methylase